MLGGDHDEGFSSRRNSGDGVRHRALRRQRRPRFNGTRESFRRAVPSRARSVMAELSESRSAASRRSRSTAATSRSRKPSRRRATSRATVPSAWGSVTAAASSAFEEPSATTTPSTARSMTEDHQCDVSFDASRGGCRDDRHAGPDPDQRRSDTDSRARRDQHVGRQPDHDARRSRNRDSWARRWPDLHPAVAAARRSLRRPLRAVAAARRRRRRRARPAVPARKASR